VGLILKPALLDNLKCKVEGKTLFANDEARALLAGRMDELCRPTDPMWQKVKQSPSRTVYRGEIDGKAIYLKHYHRKDLARRLARMLGYSYARTEMWFSSYLASRNIPATHSLAACCSPGCEWLATLAIEPSETADIWQNRNLQQGQPGQLKVRRLTIDLARTIARMHEAGVIHRDLHAGNIIIRSDTPDPRCVIMDLHRMSKRPFLSRSARAMNLAQLLHDRMDSTTRSERLRFLKHYLAASDVSGTLRGWQLMIDEFAQRHRRKLYSHRDKRIFRDNRYFSRIQLGDTWSGHVVLASKRRTESSKAPDFEFKTDDWARALAQPERLSEHHLATVIKDSPSGRVVRRHLKVGPHELDVIVKRSRRKHTWKLLIDCFRPARAIRGFRLGHELLTRGIPVATPLACLQRRVGLLLLDNILITEAHNARQLDRFLDEWLTGPASADSPLAKGDRRRLANQVLWQMGRLLQRLHDNNYRHRDLKSPNMLVNWRPGQDPEILLVDMDGLRRVMWLTVRQRFQGLMRLNVSLLRCQAVNHAGQLRLLLGYLRRTGVGRVNFKPYWRMLENWSSRKLRKQIRSRRKRQRASRR